MSDRDELATTLSKVRHVRALHLEVPASIVTHVIDGIAEAILAAGYRKPQQVTTVRDLDALPIGSVILADHGRAWQKVLGELPWQTHRFAFGATSDWIWAHRPVTVLHVGGAE